MTGTFVPFSAAESAFAPSSRQGGPALKLGGGPTLGIISTSSSSYRTWWSTRPTSTNLVSAFDQVMAACHPFPGPVWEVGKRLAGAQLRGPGSFRRAARPKRPIWLSGPSVFRL